MNKLKFCIIALCLSGCITKKYTNGVPIRPHQYKQIQNAKIKKDVFNILGSPSAQNFVGEEKWFYYTSNSEVFAFLDPKFSKYEILSISFDKNDNIKNIKLTNLVNKEISCNTNIKTSLPSDIELNFFQELFEI